MISTKRSTGLLNNRKDIDDSAMGTQLVNKVARETKRRKSQRSVLSLTEPFHLISFTPQPLPVSLSVWFLSLFSQESDFCYQLGSLGHPARLCHCPIKPVAWLQTKIAGDCSCLKSLQRLQNNLSVYRRALTAYVLGRHGTVSEKKSFQKKILNI